MNHNTYAIYIFDTEKVCCKGRALVRQRQVQKDMAKIQRDVAIANVVAQSNNASNYAPGNGSYVNVSSLYLQVHFVRSPGQFLVIRGSVTIFFSEWL